MPSNSTRLAVVLCLSLMLVSRTFAAEFGVFFDEEASVCSAETTGFGPVVPAHIFLFGDPGVEISGVILRLELPLAVQINDRSIVWARDVFPDQSSMTSPDGTNLLLQPCKLLDDTPLKLVSFDIVDLGPGGVRRPDLGIKIAGGTLIADGDSLTFEAPNLKICDPDDPEGFLELVTSTGLESKLNCDTEPCECATTAVWRRTWTRIKHLYTEQ